MGVAMVMPDPRRGGELTESKRDIVVEAQAGDKDLGDDDRRLSFPMGEKVEIAGTDAEGACGRPVAQTSARVVDRVREVGMEVPARPTSITCHLTAGPRRTGRANRANSVFARAGHIGSSNKCAPRRRRSTRRTTSRRNRAATRIGRYQASRARSSMGSRFDGVVHGVAARDT
jgi:hypothetical protein